MLGDVVRTYPIADIIYPNTHVELSSDHKQDLHILSLCDLIGTIYVLPFNIDDAERLLAKGKIRKIGVENTTQSRVDRLKLQYPYVEIVEFNTW